jgi:uncharacterized phage protein gp47/JayE
MAQYTDQTKTAILQRMLDATASDIDKRQGSITFDMLSPSAIELALAYAQLDNVLNFGFADTTYGEYLDRRAGELGLTRVSATKASAVSGITFSGTNGTVIPIGTRVSTGGSTPIYFVTTAAGTIASGTATVTAEAESAGANGNVGIGLVNTVVGNLTGVTSVTNTVNFIGGSDTESDVALLQRYYDRVRTPQTSGNVGEYRAWALSRPGVGDVKVYPIWNGNGTVKVDLLSTDKRAPSSSVISDVATYIESVRPIGATVTVIGAPEVAINVTATLTLVSGKTLSDAQTEISAGVTDYLKTLAFVDPIVRINEIGKIILDAASVLDYSGLTVNSGTGNVSIADGSVAVLGTVTLT